MNTDSQINISDFLSALQCYKKYFLNKNQKEIPENKTIPENDFNLNYDIDAFRQLTYELFPEGTNVFNSNDLYESYDLTKKMCADKASVIYEAVFIDENYKLKVDLIEHNGSIRNIYLKTASTQISEYTLNDASFQYYVMHNFGFPVDNVFIIYVNKLFKKNGNIEPRDFLIIENVTNIVIEKQEFVRNNLLNFKKINSEPKTDIGKHCHSPFTCNFKDYCWQHIPKKNSVFDLSRGGDKSWDLYYRGILNLIDIPDTYELNEKQKLQIETLKRNDDSLSINKIEIANFLNNLVYPVSILNIESFQTIIPIIEGASPYQQIPYMYSIDTINEKESAAKRESFISDPKKYFTQENFDPRIGFIDSLIKVIGDNGSILVYLSPFVKQLLEKIGQSYPQFQSKIENINTRLIDLMIVFKSGWYYDKNMGSSISIVKIFNSINSALFYGEKNSENNNISGSAYWLTALDMKEMKGAWENYVSKDKSRFKPLFSFDDIATFDRALYNQINNPLILRLFLEIYNGKQLPKKGNKHLHVWQDWFKTFNTEEQRFLKLVVDEIWLIGKNELLLDDLLKLEKLKPYLNSDIINAPYNRLKNNGWISRYVKDMNGYIGFTVEGALLYLLALQLQEQKPVIDLPAIKSLFNSGNKLQKSAIESFLCEQALNGDLNLLADLIDAGEEYIDLSIKPLLLYLKTFGAMESIEKVLENPSANDWKALNKLDEQLEELQLHVLRKEFLIALMPQNEFKTKESVGLGLNAIAILDNEEAQIYMSKIDATLSFIEEDANLLSRLGKCEKKFDNYDKALENYEKSLAIRLKTIGEDHPDVASSYSNIGDLCVSQLEFEKALAFYEKCLAIQLKTLGEEHPDVAVSYNNIGTRWYWINSEDGKALGFYEKCLAIQLKILGEAHPDVAVSYNSIGNVLYSKEEYEKALGFYDKCLAIRLKTLGGEHPDVANSYNSIGHVWRIKLEYDKALGYYEKCLAIKLKIFGKEHPSIANEYKKIGNTWEIKGEYEKALVYYISSSQIKYNKLGALHGSTIAIVYNAKRVAEKIGKENELPEWMKNFNKYKVNELPDWMLPDWMKNN